jgi:hypothetical protein
MKKLATLLLFIIPFASNAQIKAECISGNCVNGKGIYKFANGAEYDGDFADSLMSGFGVIVWQNKDKYLGDFKAGIRTGKGKYYYANGNIYEGDFKDNIFEGKGTLLYNDGSKYIGDWKSNQRNGKGWLEFKNNYVCEGDFVNNLLDGKGTMEWVEGSKLKGNKYIGEYKKGQRNGKGKYIYANGNILEGDFENDKFIDPRKAKVESEKEWEKDGYTIIYSDDNSYGNFTGKARIYKSVTYYQTFTWSQFQRQVMESHSVLLAYEGDIVKGKKEGFGKEDEKVTTKDGIVYHVWYVGEFKNGLRNGKGKMQSRTNVYDVGTYQDGVYIGR